MKHAKKLVSVMLAMVMILAMSMTALADGDSYTITIKNAAAGHTYEAYQIFTGDLSEKGVLSNVVWGTGVSADGQIALGNAATKAESLKTEEDAKAFAKAVSAYLTNSAATSSKGENGYTISNLAPGYYLVKDQNGSLNEANDSYTSYILEVVKNVEVTPKSDTPEVEKKVKDVDDSTVNSTTDWQDSADYDIGDSVPFQLKATLASNVSAYTAYKVVFHDTLSSGLTYNNDAVVKIDGSDVTGSFTISSSGTDLTISCDNVKALGAKDSSVITVEYTAKLNDKAVIGSAGNPNKVSLEYSNNPNNDQGGETGKTPEDTVIVFTYQTIVNKVDSSNKPLTGAQFSLEKYDAAKDSWTAVAVVKNTEGTTFTFSGLDDGKYRLTETTTPVGYNTIEPVYFTVTAQHDISSDTPGLKSLSAQQTNADGANLTEGVIATFSPDVNNGSLSTNIVNKSGAELPSTGGIGTTIFYIIGIVIMAGAVFFLAMNRKKKED